MYETYIEECVEKAAQPLPSIMTHPFTDGEEAANLILKQFEDIIAYSTADIHDSWTAQKANDGWVYGDVTDKVAKTHYLMKPIEELTAEEISWDEATASQVLKSLVQYLQAR